ncbi:MAG: DUF3786 domain-containing protein [Candidatus Omnitrophota bacterium]|jgi:hypothetical protein
MGYQQALEKAWDDLLAITREGETHAVKLLSDTYTVDLKNRTVLSDSCNIPAKDYTSIIILHYLAKKLKLGSLPEPSGQWIDFREIEGGEAYFPAFKKRTIDRILKKYGMTPQAILKTPQSLPYEKGLPGDAGIVLTVMDKAPILITISKADEEFGPDTNILFDKTISDIFCTEDIVVLTEIVVHYL